MSDQENNELRAIRQEIEETKLALMQIGRALTNLFQMGYQLSEIIQRQTAAAPIATRGAQQPAGAILLEAQITQALIEHGGPPEIAEQLLALATDHQLTAEVIPWIRFHTGEIWTAAEFNAWCYKFRGAAADIEAVKGKPTQ